MAQYHMLHWLKKLLSRRAPPIVLEQAPNNLFTWAAGATLTPLDDEIVIALPRDLVAADEPLDTVLTLPEEAQVGIPLTGDFFYVRLQPGMTATLARACPVYLVARDGGDTTPRRVKLLPGR
jgi:hypothetical protein